MFCLRVSIAKFSSFDTTSSHSEFRIANMQQEELLKEIKEELKEIKEQSRAITISLEKKSSCENNDENDKTKLTKKKSSSSVTTSHQEAHRSAHEWAKKRTLEKRTQEKNEKRDESPVDKYGFYSTADIDYLDSSQDESCDGRHSDQA
eukprot:scaffold185_cov42-Attheya_sp.AAC.8